MMNWSIAEEKAYQFAKVRHEAVGQLRDYTGEPYINHPVEVAGIIRTVLHDEAMVIAALLHDTVEDTETTIDEIRAEFGSDVADLVGWLTDVSKSSDGNRAIRKAIDREHTSQAPARAKTIKLADLISNSGSILAHDPAFAKVYLPEKALLLDVLRDGDPVLWNKANEIVMSGLAQLESISKQKGCKL